MSVVESRFLDLTKAFVCGVLTWVTLGIRFITPFSYILLLAFQFINSDGGISGAVPVYEKLDYN